MCYITIDQYSNYDNEIFEFYDCDDERIILKLIRPAVGIMTGDKIYIDDNYYEIVDIIVYPVTQKHKIKLIKRNL